MSGLKFKVKCINSYRFSEAEKRTIVEDYLKSGLTKQAIWEKYTGSSKEHGRILEWLHKFGYVSGSEKKNTNFVPKIVTMENSHEAKELSEFESCQLQKRITQLEAQLRSSEMECLAWQTMVELSEKEFNISIKKKYNIKPSKK